MSALPVIVGFGGFNAAGRASGHHAYRRMVLESLSPQERQETLAGLAVMMGLVTHTEGAYRDEGGQALELPEIEARFGQQVLDGTLIRRIEAGFFDVDAVHWQKSAVLDGTAQPVCFEMDERELPEPLPTEWSVTPLPNRRVQVSVSGSVAVKLDSYRAMAVKSAGQLPTGFDPADLYNARFHPRALQLAVIGASDAVQSMGIPWSEITRTVPPDQISVYASNVMSQMDEPGLGGLLQSRLKGGRVSTKQCPLGLNSMPADFVNAYIIGSVGRTGAIAGACASFLYNLNAAVEDIVSGRARVAIVGNAEAPITSEIIDGYATMGALAQEDRLKKLDGSDTTDLRRSSRPFGENCGFTIAEASTYVVLMDDALALELGADIHGAVNDVFINADGYKKSISAPGPGNYITMAKAVASARAIVGDETIQRRSMVQAHGSSTPQNRVSESEIFDRVARVFGIENWPVAAIKAYVGHSLAPASGEQLICTLGMFRYGWVPGIKTIDRVADDVVAERLDIPLADLDRRDDPIEVAFLNSKGFGGNNATASVLAPRVVERMLVKRHGQEQFDSYAQRREAVRERAAAYDAEALTGRFRTVYQFGEGLIDDKELAVNEKGIKVPGFGQEISLELPNRFSDMV